jgi:hypothetical protein
LFIGVLHFVGLSNEEGFCLWKLDKINLTSKQAFVLFLCNFFLSMEGKGFKWRTYLRYIMGTIQTIGETDFLWVGDVPTGIKRAILFDAVGTDHVPAVVGGSLIGKEPVGYITSKHVTSAPHTILSEGFKGWEIHQSGDALIVAVITPARLSSEPGEQKNAWLFNYPPARDVARMLAEVGTEELIVLTSSFYDEFFGEKEVPEEVVLVKACDFGTDEALDSLQPLWGWLPAYLFHVLTGNDACAMVMRAHGPVVQPKPFGETQIRKALGLLKNHGFDVNGAESRAMGLYREASSQATEATKMANEVLARMRRQKRNGFEGGMFG